MTPEEELLSLRRLAELQGAQAQQPSLMDKVKEGLGFAGESLGSIARGGAMAGAGAVSQLPIMKLGGGLDSLGRTGDNPLIEAFKSFVNKTNPEQPGLYHKGMEGIGSGLMAGPQAPLAAATSGAASGMAGEAAKNFTEGMNPYVSKIAQFLASIGVGGATAFGMSPRPTETAASKVARDTGILTGVAKERAGPPTSPLTAANMSEDAATAYLKDIAGNRTQMFTAMLQGEKVRASDVAQLYQTAMATSRAIAATGRGEQAEAISRAAQQLVTGDQSRFITNLQQLSLSLKNLKENPPTATASTGKMISSKDIADAVSDMEASLGQIAPAFERANKVYGTASRQIDTAKTGPIGNIADKTRIQDPASLSKLESVVSGSDPSQIVQTMAALKSGGADPAAIARALLDKRLGAGGLSPGVRAFGGPGSPMEENLNTLLQTAGKIPEQVRAPLNVADAMAEKLKSSSGSNEAVTGHLVPPGISLRGSVNPGYFERGIANRSANQQLSELLNNASPAEIEQLLKLSKFDPKLRMAITLAAIGRPAIEEK